MASEWFCLIGGEELGPLTVKQLRAMARDGRLGPGDVVRRGREGRWVHAARVQGLFSAQAECSAGPDATSQTGGQPAEPDADAPPHARAGSRSAEASSPAARAAGERPQRKPRAAALPTAKPAAGSKPVSAVGLPVAQPAPTPSVPPPAATRGPAPAAGPVGTPSGPPVAVLAPAEQPAASALGARRPARRRDNTALVVVALVILVLGLAAMGLGVYLWRTSSRGPTASEQTPSTTGSESGQQGSGALRPGGSLEGPGEQGAGETGPEQWVDASRESARVGDVTVKVLSAVVDRPRVIRSSGRGARPTEPYLVLQLQLENLRESHKLEYTTWASSQMRAYGVRLTDNLGNTYEPKTFTGVTIEGQLGREPLYPREPVTEVLVFQRPVESAQLRYLRLQLPAMAFGETGRLYFEIPAEMIQRAPEPTPEPEPEGPRPEPEPPGPPEQPLGKGPREEQPEPRPGDDEPDIFRDHPELFPGRQQPPGVGPEERPETEPGDRPHAPRLVPTPDERRERSREEPRERGREERPRDRFDERSPFGNAL